MPRRHAAGRRPADGRQLRHPGERLREAEGRREGRGPRGAGDPRRRRADALPPERHAQGLRQGGRRRGCPELAGEDPRAARPGARPRQPQHRAGRLRPGREPGRRGDRPAADDERGLRAGRGQLHRPDTRLRAGEAGGAGGALALTHARGGHRPRCDGFQRGAAGLCPVQGPGPPVARLRADEGERRGPRRADLHHPGSPVREARRRGAGGRPHAPLPRGGVPAAGAGVLLPPLGLRQRPAQAAGEGGARLPRDGRRGRPAQHARAEVPADGHGPVEGG
mmetsp:Transcript_98917/g.295418  ORF Transcript_98917/g.295418 Transcript_98917/m.295418 type:complete len:279 (+) Transcript_98917:673-1509(+)